MTITLKGGAKVVVESIKEEMFGYVWATDSRGNRYLECRDGYEMVTDQQDGQ